MTLTTDTDLNPSAPYQQFFSGFFLQKLLVMLDRIDATLADLASDANLQEIRQIYDAAIHDLQQKRGQLETELNDIVAEVSEQADPLMYQSIPESASAGQGGGLTQFFQCGLDQDEGQNDGEPVPDDRFTAVDDACVETVRGLKTGTWLLFTEDGLPPYRACYAWHNRVTNIYYFINQNGHLLLERTLDELVENLRDKSARIVGHGRSSYQPGR